jgi:hypothetical protein
MSGKLSRSLGVIVFAMASVLTFGWASPAAVMVQLAHHGAHHGWHRATPGEPVQAGSQRRRIAQLRFRNSGLVNGSGQPAGYVANAMDTYIRPNSPTARVSPPRSSGTQRARSFLGSRSFDKSVATGVAQLIWHRTPRRAPRTSIRTAGVDGGFTVFGYRRAYYAASIEKRNLIDEYFEDGTTHDAKFRFIGNAARPNGGILQRLNPLYIRCWTSASVGPSPTDSPVVGDTPLSHRGHRASVRLHLRLPSTLNLLADYNALMGLLFLHLDYFNTTDAGKGFLDQVDG